MKYLKWFYIVITILSIIGFVVNFADGLADIYQLIIVLTLGTGWYLIENK